LNRECSPSARRTGSASTPGFRRADENEIGHKGAWSLIRNKTPIVLFEENYHSTEKSGRCMCKEMPVIPVNRVLDKK
jgi:hypothetical protein